MKVKRMSMLLALVLAFGAVTGCKKNEATNTVVEEVYPWSSEQVQDTSDIPDWTGKKLTINYWQAHGAGQVSYPDAKNDVVTPEIERVTGIVFDPDTNIDNSGQNFDAKLGMLLVSRDFPVAATNVPNLKKLVEADVVYDLTELLPKYAPNLMKKYPKYIFEGANVNGGQEGKIYAVPTGVGGAFIGEDEKVDRDKVSCFIKPTEEYGYVWVREDILKQIYPDAMTQEEIENLWVNNGEFTEEQIFDVPINTTEDFINFLYKIKDLNVKEGNKQVYATYGFDGNDNWSLMQCLWQILEGRMGAFNHMFTYWDRTEDKVKFALDQEFFKKSLQTWNQMVRDNVVSKESLIDQPDTFIQKKNNGLYAVLYGMQSPDEVALQAAGKPYRYRKVYLKIKPDYERFTPLTDTSSGMQGIVLFKDALDEEDLPQVLRWIDYMVSDVGEKLVSWGPRSAGLWEETEDGGRVFTNKELEQYIVYGKDSEDAKSYNLFNGRVGEPPNGNPMMSTYKWGNQGIFHPAYMYDKIRDKADANSYYQSGFLYELKTIKSVIPAIWDYANKLDSVKKAWDARASIEAALLKILASADDADFNNNYNELLQTMQQFGWDEACLKELNEQFAKDNAAYMDQIK